MFLDDDVNFKKYAFKKMYKFLLKTIIILVLDLT